MKNIVAFGASNSKQSINKQFASWAAEQLADVSTKIIDLNDYEMPIYSIDREGEHGIPVQARAFKEEINNADGIIISLAEHNGSYTSAFKNIVDWVSRIEKGTWSNKPLLLLSTSPGPRGGMGVLGTASSSFPHQGGILAGSFSLPQFNQNFDSEKGIADESLLENFKTELSSFQDQISEISY